MALMKRVLVRQTRIPDRRASVAWFQPRAARFRTNRKLWLPVFLCVGVILPAGCGSDEPPVKPDRIIGEHGMGPGQFSKPRAIAVAQDGSIFVVDMTARIQRFSPEGEFETSWQMENWEAGKPTGIDIDPNGRVLISDTHYYRVVIFDRDGTELAHFGQQGEGPGQFGLTSAVAVAPDGRYFVGEYGGNDRISVFSPEFEFEFSFGGIDAGQASLQRPQSMLFDEEGMLWVADAVNHRICKFNQAGEMVFSFGEMGSEPGKLKYPYDLDLCPDGHIVVCEFGNNRLQWFTKEGRSVRTWGHVGSRPGELAQPWGVAVGPEGRVYVVDALNHRIQMFRM
jgi:DNA-binding beta-propeller fold protein YncE